MADEFDRLMGSGAGALAGLSAYFGGIRRENEALEQRGQESQFNALQYMAQQQLLDRQTRLAESQLASQQIERDRQYLLQKEESAFDRLNKSLEMQLNFADREAARRDKAFENSMRAEQFRIQTKAQSYQLQQLERQVQAQDLLGESEALTAKLQSGGFSNFNEYADELVGLMGRYKGGLAHLRSSGKEGAELVSNLQYQIQAARQMTTDVPSLSSETLGQKFNFNELNRLLETIDLSKPLSDDHRQALASAVEEAEKNISPEQMAGLELGEMNPDEAKLAKVVLYAESRSANPHWKKIASELKTPIGEARFQEMTRANLLTPMRDERQLQKLNQLAMAEFSELSEMMKLTNGRYLIAPEFEDARQDFEDSVDQRRYEILSGNDKNGVYALQGGIGFDTIHQKLVSQAEKNRTFSDVMELTGLPGAGRAIRSVFTGEKLNGSDFADLGMTALMFVPGVGWLARAGLTGAKFTIGAGARLAGGRLAAAAASRGMTGVRAATQATRAGDMLGTVTSAAGKELTGAARAARARAMALEGTLAVPPPIRAAGPGIRATRSALKEADVLGRELTEQITRARTPEFVTAGGRRLSGGAAEWAAKATPDELARAGITRQMINEGGEAVAQAQLRALGAQTASLQGRQLRNALGAGYAGVVATRGFTSAADFNELEEAKLKVEENIFAIKGLGRRISPAALTEFKSNLDQYKSVAGRYFDDGKIPAYLEQTLFDLRGIVPPQVARAIQREVRAGNAASMGMGGFFTNNDIRNLYNQSAAAATQVAAPGVTTQNSMSQPFNLLESATQSE